MGRTKTTRSCREEGKKKNSNNCVKNDEPTSSNISKKTEASSSKKTVGNQRKKTLGSKIKKTAVSQVKPQTKSKEHKCPNCGTVFSARQNLWKHKKYSCGKDPSIPCTNSNCSKSFHRPDELARHLPKCKGQSSSNVCLHCGKSDITKTSNFKRHVAVCKKKHEEKEQKFDQAVSK